MECKHEHLKCTDNIFTCLDCGTVVPDPFQPEPVPDPDPESDPGPVVPEKPKRTRKAAAKK